MKVALVNVEIVNVEIVNVKIANVKLISLLNLKFEFKNIILSNYRGMNRSKSLVKKYSSSYSTAKGKVQNKKQASDTVYLMQNENQILRIKNQQLDQKISSLKMELHQRNQRISDAQNQCKRLKDSINNSIFTKDIELESQKKTYLDKIALSQNHVLIYKDKISDARKQVVLEEQKIPIIISDRRNLEQQLRIIKMENQGSKKILLNLQEENEELRQRNNSLSLKKYSREPEEKNISDQIQERIRLIKNINLTQKSFKKQKTLRLMFDILSNMQDKRRKQAVLTLQRYGLKKAVLKKKLILLGFIRRNYLDSIKLKVMSILREPLNPLAEQSKCLRILQNMRQRRSKAKIWRIWRNQTAKAEYSLIRRYQSQNTIQKISQIITRGLVISSFQKLKLFNKHYRSEIGVNSIYAILSGSVQRVLFSFIYRVKQQQCEFQINNQVEKSAQEHSKMLVMSKIFYEWVALMKQKRKQSLSIKFKYFKRFKRIFTIRKRNILSEMLGVTKIKITQVNLKSVCFAALKQELFSNKQNISTQENSKVTNLLKQLKQDTENREKFDLQLNKELALRKVNTYLQRKSKQAFTIWRKQHNRIFHVEKVISIITFKMQQVINFAFSRIQKRRFEKLKLSIKDKIASCDYSYNYLVEQNSHIKSVLDKKSHELQKAKFVSIIQRLIRKEKQIKHQYFYKFLRNGYKYWKVRKSLERVDHLMSKKIKIVLFFLLKINKKQKIFQEKAQYCINKHDQKQIETLLKNAFQAFIQQRQRNKRMRRALSGIFDRNLQINFYQAFGKMRNQGYQFQVNQITQTQQRTKGSIDQTNSYIKSTEQTITVLTERLAYKQQTFKQRKIMSLYKFFMKNVKVKVGSYIWKWKNKVDDEKIIIKFVNVLDSKAQSMIKIKFLLALQRTKGELQKKQLQTRLQRYKTQYDNANMDYEKFIAHSQQRSLKMKTENEENDKIFEQNEKRTQHMNNVKVTFFLKRWDKQICKFVFREWKNHKVYFLEKWNRIFYLLGTHAIRDAFQTITGEMRFQIVKNRIRKSLSHIYNKTYKNNVGMGFKVWRNINILRKVKEHEQELRQAMKGMQNIQERYEIVKNKYYSQVDQRIHFLRLRKITNAWKIYTELKIRNNEKKCKIQNWLRVGHSVDAINVLGRNKVKSLDLKKIFLNFQTKFQQSKSRGFLKYLYTIRQKKHTIQNLFIKKFCYYQVDRLNQQFFVRVKNFYREKQTNQKDRRTYNIQKLINSFQKKRKDILCTNIRLWKRNMYLMDIQKNLLRRVVRNAMNSRVKDLFYAWKLQKQARFMVKQHTQEGQVKRRKVQIQRLKKFLDDYKKQKGLLLENQQGNFVVSPKFQQNKQKQLKRDNTLKYKFISRLILSMNGYQGPVKVWNNLSMFAKVRTKCQKAALMVKNRIEKADLFTAFKIWHNGVKQVKKMFNEMQRKDLIRILNRQKDQMEIQYGRKVQVQQKVQTELRRYKVLSYQDKRKERICAQILFKQARLVKNFGFSTWRKRVEQMKDRQTYELQERGNFKIMNMQEDVEQLESYERQLQEHNRMLREAVQEALQMADMIKKIGEERDRLQLQFSESNISCQNLQQQNEQLNNKLILAQKQAMNLLTLSGKGL